MSNGKLLKLIIILVFWIQFSTTSFAASDASFKEKDAEAEKSYLIGFKEGTEIDKKIEKTLLKEKKQKKFKNVKAIGVKLKKKELESLQTDSSISFIEEDSTISISASEVQEETIPWGIKDIGSTSAFEKGIKGKAVKVAVFDTGIAGHSDLKITGGASFVEGSAEYIDDNGHGTHVAGTIAALNNQEGVVGVAPEVELYAVKVLDQNGGGNYSHVIQGIDWAVENEINIVSMSFGGLNYSSALHQAIQQATTEGILFVAAAGNYGYGEEKEAYPARYPEVISVGAVDPSHERASFSSTGKELDLVAPGVSILSTTFDGNYGFMSGTSMAAPHTTGAAALLWSQYPELTNEQIKRKLIESAIPLGDKHEYGNGLVSITNALGINSVPSEESQTPPEENTIKDVPINKDLSVYNTIYGGLGKDLIQLFNKALENGNEDKAKEIDDLYNKLLLDLVELFKPFEEAGIEVSSNKDGSYQSMFNEFYLANSYAFQKLESYYLDAVNQLKAEMNIKSDDLPVEVLQTRLTLDKGLDVNLAAGNYHEFIFTPRLTGDYKFYTGPYAGTGSTNDTILEIYSESSFSSLLAKNDDANQSNFSEIKQNLIAGKTYYIKLYGYNYGSVYARTTVSKVEEPTTLNLNSPIDSSVAAGSYKIYRFVVPSDGRYKISTSIYQGSELPPNETPVPTEPITPPTEPITPPTEPITPPTEPITPPTEPITPPITPIEPGLPTDPIMPGEPPVEYYANEFSDSVLYIYSDLGLTKQIAYNNDSNGSVYSEIKGNYLAGKTIYIKLTGWNLKALQTRIKIEPEIQSFQDIKVNIPIDVTIGDNQFIVYKFIPLVSGLYRITTGSFNNNGVSADSVLALYDSHTLTTKINSNDDYKGSNFSDMKHRLIAGKTYYIVLNGYAGKSVSTRLSVRLGNQYFYDANGKLDYIKLPDGKIIDYIYDKNGNLIKRVLIK
jgi:hypothetical protein